MISIITPFFNAQDYLYDSIKSVMNQSYKEWELLLINDGSSDDSKKIALSFEDSRIRFFEQKNQGVSAARNLGLANMQGDYFCFFDADDVFPENSLNSRLLIFEFNKDLEFVDGSVYKMDSLLDDVIAKWNPNLQANPLDDLITMKGRSFFGPSWMVKRIIGKTYHFEEGLSHCEDLYFYLQLAREGGLYAYTSEPILYYRDSPGSAMKNLKGLENGYRFIESKIINWTEVNKAQIRIFKFKYRKAMSLAYLRKRQMVNAIKIWR